MKDIISEFYKKVLSFFNAETKDENSKDTACNRLKLVLMQDRAKMEPALMEKMREEMIEVISKYVVIDKEALDLNLEAEGDSFALMLNIPVIRAKTREEIEEEEEEEEVTEDLEEDENDEEKDENNDDVDNDDDDDDDDDDDSDNENKDESSQDSSDNSQEKHENIKNNTVSKDNETSETSPKEKTDKSSNLSKKKPPQKDND